MPCFYFTTRKGETKFWKNSTKCNAAPIYFPLKYFQLAWEYSFFSGCVRTCWKFQESTGPRTHLPQKRRGLQCSTMRGRSLAAWWHFQLVSQLRTPVRFNGPDILCCAPMNGSIQCFIGDLKLDECLWPLRYCSIGNSPLGNTKNTPPRSPSYTVYSTRLRAALKNLSS